MKKKMLILAGLVILLMSTSEAYAQIVKSVVITINQDADPIKATVKDQKIVVVLRTPDRVNFRFEDFAIPAEKVTLKIINQGNAMTVASWNMAQLEKKDEFDLNMAKLGLAGANPNDVYHISLESGTDSQLIFRFQVSD